MSSTVLEQLRAEQEEVEAIERAVVAILGEKPRNVRFQACNCGENRPILTDFLAFCGIFCGVTSQHRERVLHGHKVSNLLDEAAGRSRHVKELYEDKDGLVARFRSLWGGKMRC